MEVDNQGSPSATDDPTMGMENIGADSEPIPEDEGFTSDDGAESPTDAQRRRKTPQKLSIMARFALSRGFRMDSDSRFYDEAGNWIAKASGSLFPWELRTASGEIARHYWPKDHCLEKEPLQVEAEVWSIVEKSPEKYVLVLSDPEGKPVEITGEKLSEMQERGELTLHPSTYRLVLEHVETL
jgi:hypothetical protein